MYPDVTLEHMNKCFVKFRLNYDSGSNWMQRQVRSSEESSPGWAFDSRMETFEKDLMQFKNCCQE
jgi:hypothetical protein